MINKEKALRLSFLNIDGGPQSGQEDRGMVNSLVKSSYSQKRINQDRRIYTALSLKLRQTRIHDIQSQTKVSLMDELMKNNMKNCSPLRSSLIFQRNASLASLRINGTSILAEPLEIKTERVSKNSKKSLKISKKKRILIKNIKSASSLQFSNKLATKYLISNVPKKHNNSIHNSPKCNNESPISLYHKHLEDHQKSTKNLKPEKLKTSPLLNLKKITIKGIVNNKPMKKTNKISLKIDPEALDISGWATNN